ncbi:uncharacterized protein LOC129279428 [Lytechinus pictus]|uniref:uncharacterized protein LOC129279428 n=1 Tax=Lytechinus pictus TaxID=7653 RepID=UPI0030BA000E
MPDTRSQTGATCNTTGKMDTPKATLKKLDKVVFSISDIREEIKDMKSTISMLQGAATDSASRVETIENKVIPELIRKQKECEQNLHDAIIAQEIHERKRNLLFYGIERKTDENVEEVVRNVIGSLGLPASKTSRMMFNNVHRLPRKPNDDIKTPDPIIARFVSMSDRDEVFNAFDRLQRRPNDDVMLAVASILATSTAKASGSTKSSTRTLAAHTTKASTTIKASTTTAAHTTTQALTTGNTTTTAPTTTSATTTAAPTTTSSMTTTSNMTTMNMTTSPSNMTTMNMTTSSSNMTTMNTTTTPSNMTTINMTTTPSNMSTTATTTEQPLTTSTPESRWKVTDKNGKLCMLMDFDGTIIYEKDIKYVIPSTASIAKSSCLSPGYSRFVLEFSSDDTFFWQLILNFTTSKDSYQLNKITVNLYVSSLIVAYGSDQEEFLSVPFGDYYKCKYLNASFYPFAVNLTNPSFQPFVQKTKSGDNLGKEYLCKSPSTGVRTNVIIGIVIGIIVLAAAIAVTYYVVKRRGKPSDPPYSRVQ